MQTIVITGSTRGIGYGLADAFLEQGCAVGVSGRTEASVRRAVEVLSAKHGAQRVWGRPCDVTQFDQVQALWDAAHAHYGQIDVWINNAGLAHPQCDLAGIAEEQIETLVQTNLIGTMYGAKVVLNGMLAQGGGSLYNMEGLGSDGGRVEGLTLYATTKYAIRYLTESLVRETEGTPVLVGTLSPGMVTTNLLMGQYEDRPQELERAKRIFNILADRVETVTPWLAQKVLANKRSGVRFQWLTKAKAFTRFLTASFRKRDLFGG